MSEPLLPGTTVLVDPKVLGPDAKGIILKVIYNPRKYEVLVYGRHFLVTWDKVTVL